MVLDPYLTQQLKSLKDWD